MKGEYSSESFAGAATVDPVEAAAYDFGVDCIEMGKSVAMKSCPVVGLPEELGFGLIVDIISAGLAVDILGRCQGILGEG